MALASSVSQRSWSSVCYVYFFCSPTSTQCNNPKPWKKITCWARCHFLCSDSVSCYPLFHLGASSCLILKAALPAFSSVSQISHSSLLSKISFMLYCSCELFSFGVNFSLLCDHNPFLISSHCVKQLVVFSSFPILTIAFCHSPMRSTQIIVTLPFQYPNKL